MLAIQYARYGAPLEVATLVDLPRPMPKATEVLVRIDATPVRSADVYSMTGTGGFRAPLPAIPGETGIGTVVQIGSHVREFSIGDRVYLPRGGTWREFLAWPAAELFRAPASGESVRLAQINNNAITAYALLRFVGSLRAGDWLIQSAGTSNVGRIVIQLAHARGIHSVNLVRSLSVTDELSALGADLVLEDSDGVSEGVRLGTGNADIQVGFDMVGGHTTARMATCLGVGGTIAIYGQKSGQVPQVSFHDMLFRRLTMYGFLTEPELRYRGISRAAQGAMYDELAAAVLANELQPKVAAVYPLSDFRKAIEHFLSGPVGKIILTRDP